MQRAVRVSTIFCGCVLVLTSFFAFSKSLTIAAASDLKFALDEIVVAFTDSHSNTQIDVVFGSSGRLSTQIQHGAPYDLYFSADIEYPRMLAKRGLTASTIISYAHGQLVLYAPDVDATCVNNSQKSAGFSAANQTHTVFDILRCDVIKHIAIANPKHAPYGIRAKEALQRAGIYEEIKHKLIYAQSVSHATQYIKTNHAQVGIVALSLVPNPDVLTGAEPVSGSIVLVPQILYSPLEQGFIVTKQGQHNELAWDFAKFVQQNAVRSILQRYGFTLHKERLSELNDD